MKLKINDKYYMTQWYPRICRGCAFEDLNICTDRFGLLNDMCVKPTPFMLKVKLLKF